MNIQQYFDKMKKIQDKILDFIDNEGNYEGNLQILEDFFDDIKIRDNQYDIKLIMHIINEISKFHFRGGNFFSKIERILQYFKNEITTHYSSLELMTIFEDNKRIALFFLKEKIIIVGDVIHTINFNFFRPERDNYYNLLSKRNTLPKKESDEESYKQFDEKRMIGENDTYICSLIRNDMVEEFIIYVNKTNLSCKSNIECSVFETNSLLHGKNVSLIEYASFYGSLQIFQYLRMNNAILTPSLWYYAIHGKNAEIIHLLEEDHIIPQDYCSFQSNAIIMILQII